MADPLTLGTTYPVRPPCYPGPWSNLLSDANTSCTTTTSTMVDFLNLTEFKAYREAYCLNPPSDSCAFGYCANPDIGGPAFRFASYVCAICLSIVILFANEEAVQEALYAQLLSTYSYIIAAIIAIIKHNITRLHTVFVLQMTGSPLSFYLVTTMLKAIAGKRNNNLATWRRKLSNRVLLLALVPLWIAVLVYAIIPSNMSHFQQADCDYIQLDGHAGRIFWIPVAVFFVDRSLTIVNVTLLAVLILTWAVCIYLQRDAARKLMAKEGRWWLTATWHSVVDAYPFIQLITVVIYPNLYWILALESAALVTEEEFQPSYGQLLAIFIAVPPVLQTIPLTPRIPPWFTNLTWVRFLTCRRRTARKGSSLSASGKYLALDDATEAISDGKSDFEAKYLPTNHVELQSVVHT